jgi:CRP-like cAMP-binding protein
MDRQQKSREAARERIKAAETRLQRLREVIERRARSGFDTSEGWRLFRLTATSLANMRQSEALLEALFEAGRARGRPARCVPLSVEGNGAERVAFNPGTVIQTGDHGTQDCHLIESGLVSFCFGDAGGIEVGMVGPGGVVGISGLLAAEPMPIAAVATTRCRTVLISITEFASRIGSDNKGVRFLHASVARQWAETMILARCNAEHSVRERVARWILTGGRHLQGPIGPVSHDRIASLLGVRRASVTVALHEIEGESAIGSRRNIIEIRDERASRSSPATATPSLPPGRRPRGLPFMGQPHWWAFLTDP